MMTAPCSCNESLELRVEVKRLREVVDAHGRVSRAAVISRDEAHARTADLEREREAILAGSKRLAEVKQERIAELETKLALARGATDWRVQHDLVAEERDRLRAALHATAVGDGTGEATAECLPRAIAALSLRLASLADSLEAVECVAEGKLEVALEAIESAADLLGERPPSGTGEHW